MSPSTKTAVVTGASSGIGLALSVALARQCYRLVLVGRDTARLAAAADEVRAASPAGAAPVVLRADLATLAGARALADQLLAAVPRLEVLVHNAGVLPTARALTADGFESAFATNHLAPYVLNQALAARLRASAPARVVQVSAGLYVAGAVDAERSPLGLPFNPFRTYGTSKLWNLYATLAFADALRDTGVTVNAVHPGVVRTRLGDHGGVRGAVLALVKRLWATPARGARGPLHLATAPALAGLTGRYFNALREEALRPVARDPAHARVVLERTRALVGG